MPDYLTIQGGKQLNGRIRVSGAKNAALPLLIATVLTAEPCVLRNIPDLEDITVTIRLLKSIGAKAEFNYDRVSVEVPQITLADAPYSLVKSLRASFWILGPLIARHGEARVALPGGDAIGVRPVDLHLKGLSQFGAQIELRHGVVVGSAPNGLRPAAIELGYPSVGATHHLMMTAALIPGETTIRGAAREPEIVALAEFLQALGAEVRGAGTETITILGKSKLGGADIEVLGDRIEAATYLFAGAVTGGKISVGGIQASALRATLKVLGQMGCEVISSDNAVALIGPKRLRAIDCETAPYPGLATDVQPLLMAALTVAEGTSRVRETVFDNRFGHAAEFRRLGAEINVEGDTAIISGVEQLSAAPVQAGDIRAAAALVVMGLAAQGRTSIYDIHHLDRGYDGLVDKLRAVGAEIVRVPAYEESEIVFGC